VAVQESIAAKLAIAIGPMGLDERVCCICDELTLTADTERHAINMKSATLLMSMKERVS
jgi:hypothetical protein